VLLALVGWQGWLTLGLFGADPWHNLLSDQPIVSGRHPLHLYHGFLGARSWTERGTLCCYDPSFHAGYPKTPVFDSGSRPTELALVCVGARFCPATYKVTQAILCLLVPFVVYLAARGLHLSRATGVGAVLLVQLVWWGRPGRDALEAGDSDLLLGSLAVALQAGLLVRYHDKPAALPLIGLAISGLLGWFAHPLLMVLMIPPVLIYYLFVGPQHRLLWHMPLFGTLLFAVIANTFWLTDLIRFWWVRVVPELDTPLADRLTLGAILRSELWGDTFDRGLCFVMLGLASLGLVVMHRGGQAVGARLIGVSMGGMFLLAIIGLLYDPLGRLGAAQLIVPALLLACLPVACLSAWLLDGLRRQHPLLPLLSLLALTLLWAVITPARHQQRVAQLLTPRPFAIGYGPEREAVVEAILEATTDEGRILWEDRLGGRFESRWTALLALRTSRCFVGGLEAGAGIEHTATGLVDGRLAGRAIQEWTDGELDDYCNRYNIKWIVTSSSATRERLSRWSDRAVETTFPNQQHLFALKRKASFTLTGSAQVLQADSRGIVLRNAIPDKEGMIHLCWHYQKGMRVSPSRVQIEEQPTTTGTISFVRLRLDAPAGHILITWEGR
jgi:hypothetical protein